MACDPELEQLLRNGLEGCPWLGEKRMFGGVAWMTSGNMICAAIGAGMMARVGKHYEPDALTLPGVAVMAPGGRRMGGWVLASEDAWRNDMVRQNLLSAAVSFALTLPDKEPKD